MSLTPIPRRNTGRVITDEAILEVVLQAIKTTNAARPPSSLLTETSDAPLFGPGSPLDSLPNSRTSPA